MSIRLKLTGRRVVLRPFNGDDYESWRAIRQQNIEWLEPWEPRQAFLNQAELIGDRRAFAMRCSGRDRERKLGTGWAFGVFLESSLIGEMNLSNVVRGAFQNANLHPKNLSRCLEDAGTLTSPLIAYNTCGAYMSKVLGVSAGEYFLFAFLNLITPVISVLYGFTGWTIKPLEKEEIRD